MKKNLLAFVCAICIAPVFAQPGVYNGEISILDGTSFHRPNSGTPPVGLSITGTDVYYDKYTFEITVPGSITITSNSIWDNFGVLYGPGGFNPLLSIQNALTANDDFSGPNFGITYDCTAIGTYTIVICSFKNDVTGNYSLTIGTVQPLPLKLLSFTAAKAAGNSNLLNWVTEEESNLVAYQVQRSNDENNYKDLSNGNIPSKNSTAKTSYSFTDINPAAGNNYYRLKITEKTGLITYSSIAFVKNSNNGLSTMKIFPNPVADFVKLEAKSAQNAKAIFTVISSNGETLIKGQNSFNSQGVLTVDARKLPAGKYFLKTTIDKEESTISFIKK